VLQRGGSFPIRAVVSKENSVPASIQSGLSKRLDAAEVFEEVVTSKILGRVIGRCGASGFNLRGSFSALLMYCWPRAEPDHFAPIFALLGTGIFANGMQVVPETLGVFFPDSPNALDDWIGLHDYTSKSSCGVQIVGGS